MEPRAKARDLPEELALPLASGAAWWYWLGGRPAIDLVNTLRERWRRRVETLVTPDDLGLWLVRAQLAPAPPHVTRGRSAKPYKMIVSALSGSKGFKMRENVKFVPEPVGKK